MDGFDAAFSDLSKDFDRADHLISLVNAFRDFGASETSNTTQWPEAAVLWAECQSRRTDLPVLSGSLLLYLVGRFENFVRTIVEVAAEELAGQCGKFADLPSRLRKELVVRTAEVVQNPRRFGVDELEAESFIVTLADGLRATTQIHGINSRCLSSTEANLRPEVLADLMKRLGMENVWPDIGKQARTKLYLKTPVESDATAEAKSRLNALMEDRNRIAHPTAQTAFPDPTQVSEGISFLRMLSEVLIDLLRVYVVGFRGGAS